MASTSLKVYGSLWVKCLKKSPGSNIDMKVLSFTSLVSFGIFLASIVDLIRNFFKLSFGPYLTWVRCYGCFFYLPLEVNWDRKSSAKS
ncbi:hypothetical protein Nepgr_005199 [Nepenthes gracilis]|uniref:Uncharacterized protein n=1 Tax=Nepenthes gracilis TaxID=150966 RepID=A0AAD3XG46_NEPGR|nr:hypothetical protein Nepgr_005199 [Nepenthes gracilis]